MADPNHLVEDITAQLTYAQREAVLLFDAADFAAAEPARRAAMMDGLGSAGVRPLRVAGLVTRANQIRGISSVLTPLGVRVRNHLISTPDMPKGGGA